MRVAFITRSTLFNVPGGDTTQVLETARHLNESGVAADILSSSEPIRYEDYDIFHFFNLTRPADILYHLNRIQKPAVLSPIHVDYSEYDRKYRKGWSGFLLRLAPPDRIEYLKTIGRWLRGNDVLRSREYLWKGQRKSILKILRRIDLLIPISPAEKKQIEFLYGPAFRTEIIPYGISDQFFSSGLPMEKDSQLVVCAARFEGLKNQLNLIKALNKTRFRLLLIGSPAPNQLSYYTACRKAAADNIEFLDHIPQQELIGYFQKARVHVLPSWFETCGLSSLEAASLGCSIVITDKGFTRDYFGDDALYCDPSDPVSIREAVEKAMCVESSEEFQTRIREEYTWRLAAQKTKQAYESLLS